VSKKHKLVLKLVVGEEEERLLQNGSPERKEVKQIQLIANQNGSLVRKGVKQIQLIANLNGNLVHKEEKQIL